MFLKNQYFLTYFLVFLCGFLNSFYIIEQRNWQSWVFVLILASVACQILFLIKTNKENENFINILLLLYQIQTGENRLF